MIHWELCKKLKIKHINKWYMYKPESVLDNETHKIRCVFEISSNLGQKTRLSFDE